MGELNESTNYGEAVDGLREWLAQYLYDNYCHDKEPSRDIGAGIGDTEPWESAGKRKRETYYGEADKLITEFSKLVIGAIYG